MRYRPELDGLRAFAVLGVLLLHAKAFLPFGFSGGGYGVDLFFVLSGFLITTLLVEGQMNDLSAFYLRRVLRLMPALAVLLVVGSVVAAVKGVPPEGTGYVPVAAAAFFGVGNWFMAAGKSFGVLLHTWSLGIEWQFYLVWPAVLVAALKRRVSLERLAAYALGAAVVVGVTRGILYHQVDAKWAEFPTFSRSDGVLVGSALALLVIAGGPIVDLLRHHTVAIGAAAVAGMIIASTRPGGSMPFDGGLFVLVCCFALVIGHVTVRETSPFARALRSPGLVHLGRISYGVYLFHIPVFLIVLPAFGVVAAISATVAVAAVSFVCVERPALRLKSTLTATRRRETHPSVRV